MAKYRAKHSAHQFRFATIGRFGRIEAAPHCGRFSPSVMVSVSEAEKDRLLAANFTRANPKRLAHGNGNPKQIRVG
jgi:hypothetical protein